MLLVGIGGSGRQSLSRIGSYMCDMSTYQVAITAQYRLAEFREDLKTLYSMVGVENKPTSFLFNDTQVVEEQFLEIVNNMLSTGEVANLYKSDEMENVSWLIRFASQSFSCPFEYNPRRYFIWGTFYVEKKINEIKKLTEMTILNSARALMKFISRLIIFTVSTFAWYSLILYFKNINMTFKINDILKNVFMLLRMKVFFVTMFDILTLYFKNM